MEDSFSDKEDTPSKRKITGIKPRFTLAHLCLEYISNENCNKQDCTYLHVCKDYITDTCSKEEACPLNHQFHNERDKSLLSKNGLDKLTKLQLKELLLSLTPQICGEYNNGVCSKGDSCNKIHMCRGYLRKCCSGENECGLDHIKAMDTSQTQAVLKRLVLNHIDKHDLLKMILDDKLSVSGQDNTKYHIHHGKPDAYICSQFLIGKCNKGLGCKNHHCSLPYHWQYRVLRSEWKSYDEKENMTLEKLYCDVNAGQVEAQDDFKPTQPLDASRLERKRPWSRFSRSKFVIDLDDMTIKLQLLMHDDRVSVGQLRRLSTESYVYATQPCDLVSTNWKWYWKDEGNIWHLYDKDYSEQDLQKLIEQAFLSSEKKKTKGSYKFTAPTNDECNLEFNLSAVMYKVNLKTKTKRQVRRRPDEPLSNEDMDNTKRVLEHSVNRDTEERALMYCVPRTEETAMVPCIPSHWSSMPPDVQYTRVTLDSSSDEFKEVEQLFRETMNDQTEIESIERVQNPSLWEKYCRNKEIMITAVQRFEERKFFHIASPGSVLDICKDNFQKGAVFAKNVFLSQLLNERDDDLPKPMFLAKVLVGSNSKGHSGYQIPVTKQGSNSESDLPDSCVDDLSNPTTYVALDANPFYPEYIIKYSSPLPLLPLSVLAQEEQTFEKYKRLTTAIGINFTALVDNLTNLTTSATVQPMTKNSSLGGYGGKYSQSVTALQEAASNKAGSSRQDEVESSSQLSRNLGVYIHSHIM